MHQPTPPDSEPSTPDPDAGADRVVLVVLPAGSLMRLLVPAVVLAFGGMFVLLELAFARYAPWIGTEGMGALVTMVWGHYMLPVIRRERPVGRGVARAFGIAGALALGIAAAFYLIQG
jgi:hypothetical protein